MLEGEINRVKKKVVVALAGLIRGSQTRRQGRSGNERGGHTFPTPLHLFGRYTHILTVFREAQGEYRALEERVRRVRGEIRAGVGVVMRDGW